MDTTTLESALEDQAFTEALQRSLKQGEKGVSYYDRTARGRALNIDGIAGEHTRKGLQRLVGARDDGIIGKRTIKKLKAKFGLEDTASEADLVQKMRQHLQESGLYQEASAAPADNKPPAPDGAASPDSPPPRSNLGDSSQDIRLNNASATPAPDNPATPGGAPAQDLTRIQALRTLRSEIIHHDTTPTPGAAQTPQIASAPANQPEGLSHTNNFDIEEGIPIISTGDPVRDAVMRQAISVLGVRDNTARNSDLQIFLTRTLPKQAGIQVPRLHNGTQLPATGNDICGLFASGVYASVEQGEHQKTFPYTFEGMQKLQAFRNKNPEAVHRLGDGYTPQPGDSFITHHPGGGSHAGIVVGTTEDSKGTDVYTIDVGRVDPAADHEHHAVFSHFHVDRQAQQFTRQGPGVVAHSQDRPDDIYIVDISRLPGHQKLGEHLSHQPVAPTQFPSYAGDHADVREASYAAMAQALPKLQQFAPPVAIADAAKPANIITPQDSAASQPFQPSADFDSLRREIRHGTAPRTEPAHPNTPAQRTIVLDSGHGDHVGGGHYDPGAVITDADGHQVEERTLNQRLTDAVANELEQRGFHVVRSTEQPEFREARGKDSSMLARTAGSRGAEALISLHHDVGDGNHQIIFNRKSAVSETLARQLEQKTGLTPHADDRKLAVLKPDRHTRADGTQRPAILIEAGKLDNPDDRARVMDPTRCVAYAAHLADSITSALNTPEVQIAQQKNTARHRTARLADIPTPKPPGMRG